MKKILACVTILSICAAFFCLCKISMAKEAPNKCIILFMEGDVKIKSALSSKWKTATEEMVLSKGDSLKTGVESWTEVGFGKDFKNAVRIKENTLVEFSDLKPIEIGLLKGEIRSLIEGLYNVSTFAIRTPVAVCGVRGTGFDVSTDGKNSIVDTYEDTVFFDRLSADGKVVEEVMVEAEKRGLLENQARPIKIKPVPPGRIIDWYKWKKDFLKRRMELIQVAIDKKIKKLKSAKKVRQRLKKSKDDINERKDRDAIDRRIRSSDN